MSMFSRTQVLWKAILFPLWWNIWPHYIWNFGHTTFAILSPLCTFRVKMFGLPHAFLAGIFCFTEIFILQLRKFYSPIFIHQTNWWNRRKGKYCCKRDNASMKNETVLFLQLLFFDEYQWHHGVEPHTYTYLHKPNLCILLVNMLSVNVSSLIKSSWWLFTE